jgi:hypothetical protein
MTLFGKPRGEKYHTRTIEVTTYEYDKQRLAIEGCLTDRRWQEYFLFSGKRMSPGILHQMIIHLLVNKANLEIEDVHVEMPFTPREECPETIGSLESVRGLKISAGFTAKVKALSGKGKGCTHLVELLTAMGPATIQGYVASKVADKPLDSSQLLNHMIKMLEHTCWAWRTNGVMMTLLKEKINYKGKE